MVQRILLRDTKAKIQFSQAIIGNPEHPDERMEHTVTVQHSMGGICRYSIWQAHDGTVGGAKWIL